MTARCSGVARAVAGEQESGACCRDPPARARAVARAHAQGFDVVVHFSISSPPPGPGSVSGRAAPTVLHATAHDEPAFWLPATTRCSRCRLGSLGPPRRNVSWLLRRGAPDAGAVIGVGVDLASPGRARASGRSSARCASLSPVRRRVEAGKGSEELLSFFAAYKEATRSARLVFVGPRGRHGSTTCASRLVDDQQRRPSPVRSRWSSHRSSRAFPCADRGVGTARPVLVQGQPMCSSGRLRRETSHARR